MSSGRWAKYERPDNFNATLETLLREPLRRKAAGSTLGVVPDHEDKPASGC